MLSKCFTNATFLEQRIFEFEKQLIDAKAALQTERNAAKEFKEKMEKFEENGKQLEIKNKEIQSDLKQ